MVDPARDAGEMAVAVLAAVQGGLMLARLHRDLHVLASRSARPSTTSVRGRRDPAADPAVTWVSGGERVPVRRTTEIPHEDEGARVADNAYSKTEIVGSSAESVDEAIRGAIRRASATLRQVSGSRSSEIRGHVQDGEVGHFQVTLKVGLRPRGHQALSAVAVGEWRADLGVRDATPPTSNSLGKLSTVVWDGGTR